MRASAIFSASDSKPRPGRKQEESSHSEPECDNSAGGEILAENFVGGIDGSPSQIHEEEEQEMG